jgi:hypothetical protein
MSFPNILPLKIFQNVSRTATLSCILTMKHERSFLCACFYTNDVNLLARTNTIKKNKEVPAQVHQNVMCRIQLPAPPGILRCSKWHIPE